MKWPEHWYYTYWKSNVKIPRKLSDTGSLILLSPTFCPFVEILHHFQLTRNLILLSSTVKRGKGRKNHKHPVLPSLNFAKIHFTLHVMFSHPQFDHMTDIPLMIWKYWECSQCFFSCVFMWKSMEEVKQSKSFWQLRLHSILALPMASSPFSLFTLFFGHNHSSSYHALSHRNT